MTAEGTQTTNRRVDATPPSTSTVRESFRGTSFSFVSYVPSAANSKSVRFVRSARRKADVCGGKKARGAIQMMMPKFSRLENHPASNSQEEACSAAKEIRNHDQEMSISCRSPAMHNLKCEVTIPERQTGGPVIGLPTNFTLRAGARLPRKLR